MSPPLIHAALFVIFFGVVPAAVGLAIHRLLNYWFGEP